MPAGPYGIFEIQRIGMETETKNVSMVELT